MTNKHDELIKEIKAMRADIKHGVPANFLIDVVDGLLDKCSIALTSSPEAPRKLWKKYPNEAPELYEALTVSYPLLFETEDDTGNYIRLGFYDDKDKAFYESGDNKKLPWKYSVIKFYHFPETSDVASIPTAQPQEKENDNGCN